MDRAMIRVDQILAEIAQSLSARSSGPHEHPRPPANSALHPPSVPHEPSAPHAHHQPATPEAPAPFRLETVPGATAAPRPMIPDGAKGIALLRPSDQAAALAQKTCPVTGGALGAMGKPVKVTLGDRTVFVCCQGCVEKVKNNPSEYLPKSR